MLENITVILIKKSSDSQKKKNKKKTVQDLRTIIGDHSGKVTHRLDILNISVNTAINNLIWKVDLAG